MGFRAAISNGGGLLALAALIGGAFLLYLASEGGVTQEIGVDLGEKTELVPASGDRGFDLEAFVCGKGVDVTFDPAPDESPGTYTMTRTLNGVFESAKLVQGAPTGTHYWEQDGVQQSESAFVTDKALECIEEKRR